MSHSLSPTTYLVGTTGSGKTALALALSRAKPSVLISADSRQVYRHLDIVTGKDHPVGTELYGIDLVDPDQACSVSHWYHSLAPVILQARHEGKPVIVVGGTGFYVRALREGIATLNVPHNPELRTELATLDVPALQARLRLLAPDKFLSFNQSDQHNPRRLVRAIEVASSSPPTPPAPALLANSPSRLIGLYYADPALQQAAIAARVQARLASGAIAETEALLHRYSPTLPSLSALGYSSIRRYLSHDLSYDAMIADWVHAELSYVKRQLTYFRRQAVTWYDRGRMSVEEIYEHLSR